MLTFSSPLPASTLRRSKPLNWIGFAVSPAR
jgi:hypothetical protein